MTSFSSECCVNMKFLLLGCCGCYCPALRSCAAFFLSPWILRTTLTCSGRRIPVGRISTRILYSDIIININIDFICSVLNFPLRNIPQLSYKFFISFVFLRPVHSLKTELSQEVWLLVLWIRRHLILVSGTNYVSN